VLRSGVSFGCAVIVSWMLATIRWVKCQFIRYSQVNHRGAAILDLERPCSSEAPETGLLYVVS
jgi:hypothetical protein